MNEFSVPLLQPESQKIDEPMKITTDTDEVEKIIKHLKKHHSLEKWVVFLTWFPLVALM